MRTLELGLHITLDSELRLQVLAELDRCQMPAVKKDSTIHSNALQMLSLWASGRQHPENH